MAAGSQSPTFPPPFTYRGSTKRAPERGRDCSLFKTESPLYMKTNLPGHAAKRDGSFRRPATPARSAPRATLQTATPAEPARRAMRRRHTCTASTTCSDHTCTVSTTYSDHTCTVSTTQHHVRRHAALGVHQPNVPQRKAPSVAPSPSEAKAELRVPCSHTCAVEVESKGRQQAGLCALQGVAQLLLLLGLAGCGGERRPADTQLAADL
eukprot:365726-Chlamydomonas_euryale.AAC.4